MISFLNVVILLGATSLLLNSQHIIAARKCLKLLIQIIQNVSITMWDTADTKMSASLIIPKKTVLAKTAAPENVLKDIEEVVGMVKHVKEEKYVNILTMKRTAIVIFPILKLRWRVWKLPLLD